MLSIMLLPLLGPVGCGGPASPPAASTAAAEEPFQTALQAFKAALPPADAASTGDGGPALEAAARALASAAKRRLDAHGVPCELLPGGLSVRVLPSEGTSLGALAGTLAEQGVSAVYDLSYFVQNPYAAASFDRAGARMLLPHSAIADLRGDDPTVAHERVHVGTWARRRAGVASPYEGYVQGPAFQPNELHFDEMLAYACDLSAAAVDLAGIIDAGALDQGTGLAGLVAARASGGRPDPAPVGPLKAFDRVFAKAMFGQNHSDPAVDALHALVEAARSGAPARFVAAPPGVDAELRAVFIDGTDLTATIPLVGSVGPEDPGNPAALQAQLGAMLEVARARSAGFEEVLAAARGASEAVEVEARRAALQRMVRDGGAPLGEDCQDGRAHPP